MATMLFLTAKELPIFFLIGVVAGMYWFCRGFRLLKRKRLILNTPSSKIRSAAMGLVEINGLATGPSEITSPLKQIPCYYYRSLGWEWRQEGKNSKWVKVADETMHVPFYLDDGSGKLLIDPEGAEMDLHCDLYQEYNRSIFLSGPEMPFAVRGFLSRHGADPDRRTKVEEYLIKPKNYLFVLGTLAQNPGLEAARVPSWGEQAGETGGAATADDLAGALAARHFDSGNGQPQVIRLSTAQPVAVAAEEMSQQQKIAAALLKAGITSPAAWSVAGVPLKMAPQTRMAAAVLSPGADSQRAEEQPQRPASPEEFDLRPPVVLMRGSHQPSFFISWKSQREVVKSLAWKSALMIWAGPALALVSIYFFLSCLRVF